MFRFNLFWGKIVSLKERVLERKCDVESGSVEKLVRSKTFLMMILEGSECEKLCASY